MRYRTLRILRRHIRTAKRNDWNQCPICRALQERYPKVRNIQVFDEYIMFNGRRFAHTESTREFAHTFNTEDVDPYTLIIPNFANALS